MDKMSLWAGILICLSQSAVFSGLTIGFFGLNRLRLEVKAASKDKDAVRIMKVRENANYLLATLLWGNVGVNVILTLLTDSVLTGVQAFLFSTVVITLFGEIAPQAYLSRNALRVGALLLPFVRFYQVLLFPVAWPTAFLLDLWLGKEGISYFGEKELKLLLMKHLLASETEISRMEGLGAINFLTLDDVYVKEEGEIVDPVSIIKLSFEKGRAIISEAEETDFLKQTQLFGKCSRKWIILVDEADEPQLVLDGDKYLKVCFVKGKQQDLNSYCFKPIVVKDADARLADILGKLNVEAEHEKDDVVDKDVILFWGEEKRIITGADLLGRLLRGVVGRSSKAS